MCMLPGAPRTTTFPLLTDAGAPSISTDALSGAIASTPVIASTVGAGVTLGGGAGRATSCDGAGGADGRRSATPIVAPAAARPSATSRDRAGEGGVVVRGCFDTDCAVVSIGRLAAGGATSPSEPASGEMPGRDGDVSEGRGAGEETAPSAGRAPHAATAATIVTTPTGSPHSATNAAAIASRISDALNRSPRSNASARSTIATMDVGRSARTTASDRAGFVAA